MGDLETTDRGMDAPKKYRHLSHRLVLWFLLLSLLPLMLTAWLGYRQTIDGLTRVAAQELAQDAMSSARFTRNWFDYRFMDLNTQSENRHKGELLAALRAAFLSSGKSLAEFIHGDEWAGLVEEHEQDIKNFMRHYDYIYDLFLIDIDGNILYTVEQESDLGTNLFNGTYAGWRG